jgi:hypothetical protein
MDFLEGSGEDEEVVEEDTVEIQIAKIGVRLYTFKLITRCKHLFRNLKSDMLIN